MSGVNSAVQAMIDVVLGDEFAYDGIDHALVNKIHQGEIGRWVADLARSGLFSSRELDAIEAEWAKTPALLVRVLMADFGEVHDDGAVAA